MFGFGSSSGLLLFSVSAHFKLRFALGFTPVEFQHSLKIGSSSGRLRFVVSVFDNFVLIYFDDLI